MTVFQRTIPYDVLAGTSLPGVAAMAPKDWLVFDDAYAGQMARREALFKQNRSDVLQIDESAQPAAQELLSTVLDFLADARAGFQISSKHVQCPDGRIVLIDPADPMLTLGRLVQDDFCILQKPSGFDEHILTAAILCFPANWRLAQKFMRPLTHIHVPVEEYTDDIAKRVQRLFDGIKVGRPMWRHNALWYSDPELFQPARGGTNPKPVGGGTGPYMRSERQTLLRLPLTGAVVFGIHTFLVRAKDLPSPST